MKKIYLVCIAILLVSTLLGPIVGVKAETIKSLKDVNNKNIYFKYSEVVNGETFYTYEYNGIEFSGNRTLSEKQLKDLSTGISGNHINLINNDNLGDIELGTFYIPRDQFPGSIVAGPYYRHYDNSAIRQTADLIVAWVSTKIPKFLSKSTVFNYVLSDLTKWTDAIKDTYVGTWVTKE